MSKALYRKYRSKSLSEVIGQRHITDILTRSIAQDKISHAYLLTGPRGVGKTSVARILAHEINKLPYNDETNHLDIIEIDAASNNGVEDVRDLREKAQIAPVSARKKVYIIDEVHMLSKAAFNALLKTLEEPPEHIVFILATTNIEKLPATIVSRAQRFGFRPISIDDVVNHLEHIAKLEKISIEKDALKLIAQRGDGSFRDSISLLDQLSSLMIDSNSMITTSLIEESLGLAPTSLVENILSAVENKNLGELIKLLDDAFNNGVEATILVNQLTTAISQNIQTKPQLLPLLDSLIDVNKSSQPQLKLISVLGMASAPKQTVKTAALMAPVLEVKASIEDLQKKPVSAKKPTVIKEQFIQPEEPKEIVKKKDAVKTCDFDWDKLIEHTRQNYVAIYSVLSKCKHEINGNDLTIYTGSAFYKKKLDDVKYSPLISKSIEDLGFGVLDIHIIPTNIPPSDEAAAAITAMMGGGVEISLESI